MGEAKRKSQSESSAPLGEEFKDGMNKLASFIDHTLNGGAKGEERKTGFVLLVFPFGEGVDQYCNYISNAGDRQDLICLFKEMIARFEGQPNIKGHA